MSRHNLDFHDKIGKILKYPKIFVFLSCRKNFPGTQKRVRISHGKRVIGVPVIKVSIGPIVVYLKMEFCSCIH